MLKNIIALAIVTIFASAAYAQAPVAAPTKAIEAAKPALAGTIPGTPSKADVKIDEKAVDAKQEVKIDPKMDATKVDPKAHVKHMDVKKTEIKPAVSDKSAEKTVEKSLEKTVETKKLETTPTAAVPVAPVIKK